MMTPDREYLDARFGALDDKLDDFGKRLFGNGQPGEIDKLWTAVESNRRIQDEKIQRVWNRVLLITGGIAAISGGAAFLYHAATIAQHLGK